MPKRSGSTRIICCTDLISHQGPMLTVANWSGTWPGLVGMLNLNGSLTKAGGKYSTLWSEDFAAPEFRKKLDQWLAKGRVPHRTSHVTPFAKVESRRLGTQTGRHAGRTTATREGHHGRL